MRTITSSLQHEWSSLRRVRWLGSGLGASLPLLVLLGIEASRHLAGRGGDLPEMGRLRAVAAVVLEAASLWLWPFLALVIGIQAFSPKAVASKRARGRAWLDRMVASMGTLLVVVLMTLAVWAGTTALAGFETTGSKLSLSWDDLERDVSSVLLVGVVRAVGFLLAGSVAAAFTRRAFAALPLGLALGVLPDALASVSAVAFPYAFRGGQHVGAIAACLVPVGFAAASFTSFTAVREARIVRGAISLVIALIASCFLFAALARSGPRLDAGSIGPLRIEPSPAAPRAVLVRESDTSGWLVDGERAIVVASFRPPNEGCAWTSDGSILAVRTSSGPMGSRSRPRVGFFDRGGKPAARTWIAPDPHSVLLGSWWAEGRLAVRSQDAHEVDRLDIVDPATGGALSAELPPPPTRWGVAGPDHRGGLIVAIAPVNASLEGDRVNAPFAGDHANSPPAGDRLDPRGEPALQPHAMRLDGGYTLHRLDVRTGALDPKPLYTDERPLSEGMNLSSSPTPGHGTRNRSREPAQEALALRATTRSAAFLDVSWQLSPSGRYWLRPATPPSTAPGSAGPAPNEGRIVSLSSAPAASREPGATVNSLVPWEAAAWLWDDSLLRIERNGADRALVLERPGESPRVLRRWPGKVAFAVSPDRRRVLVRDLAGSAEDWVYEPATSGWTRLPAASVRRTWAGPSTLLLISPEALAFEDIEPHRIRPLVGDSSAISAGSEQVLGVPEPETR